jgi:hypothetical protein
MKNLFRRAKMNGKFDYDSSLGNGFSFEANRLNYGARSGRRNPYWYIREITEEVSTYEVSYLHSD